ncbi:MAG: MFS transporter, partial [Eggerthellaceae bacterium]|nr:MFS transporter [Eggerthellaceae bacterium]
MSATQKKPVFYGWLLAGAAWLSTLTTTGMLGNTWSQFLKPVCEEFGMQRASFSMISLTASIIALLLYPIAGSVLNKHRSPWLIRGAVAVLLCGYVGYSFATTKAMLFISAVVYGLGGPFTNMLMVNIVLNNWFHAKKGFVMGFVSTGSGVG